MGIFDFWRKRGGVNRAGFFDTPPVLAKRRYLASLAGSNGLMALRVSGFTKNSSEDEAAIVGRYVGRRTASGEIEFVEATAQQASDWLLMKTALLKAAGTYEQIKLQNGGTIVMSTDVNVKRDAGIVGKIKGMIDSFVQRYITRSSTVEKTIEDVEKQVRPATMPPDERAIPAYSMGNLFQGRYYGEDPNTKQMTLFNEKSFAVEIRGINTEVLNAVANAMREAFNQESVLVLNDNDNVTYLIKGVDQKEAPKAA